MITLNFTRNENGVISIERELTQEEQETLISTCFGADTVSYYFVGDILPYDL